MAKKLTSRVHAEPVSPLGEENEPRDWHLTFMEAAGRGELKTREKRTLGSFRECWKFAWERALTIAAESGYYNHVRVQAESERLPRGGEPRYNLVDLCPTGYVLVVERNGNELTRQDLPHVPISEVRGRTQTIVDAVAETLRKENREASSKRLAGRLEAVMEQGDTFILGDPVTPSV